MAGWDETEMDMGLAKRNKEGVWLKLGVVELEKRGGGGLGWG